MNNMPADWSLSEIIESSFIGMFVCSAKPHEEWFKPGYIVENYDEKTRERFRNIKAEDLKPSRNWLHFGANCWNWRDSWEANMNMAPRLINVSEEKLKFDQEVLGIKYEPPRNVRKSIFSFKGLK